MSVDNVQRRPSSCSGAACGKKGVRQRGPLSPGRCMHHHLQQIQAATASNSHARCWIHAPEHGAHSRPPAYSWLPPAAVRVLAVPSACATPMSLKCAPPSADSSTCTHADNEQHPNSWRQPGAGWVACTAAGWM